MQITHVRLRNFRNYASLDIGPGAGLNILVGHNAQGKSNLLEALYLLATTKSFRAGRESETILTGESEAVISAELVRGGDTTCDVQITINASERKSASINGAKRPRAVDLLGALNAVFFGALDLRLVTGEPTARRRYMDLAISQMSPRYCYDLASYKRTLDHRNRLLRDLRDRPRRDSGLDVWNEQLVRYGAPIIEKRRSFGAELSELAAEAHSDLSGAREMLDVCYAPSVPPSGPDVEGIADAFVRAIESVERDEQRRGTTLVGPQRDDLRFTINGVEARAFASQGQQRTIVLSLKMAELRFMETHAGEPPIMLLDDVMSDLDDARRARLMSHVNGRCQTFVTCTNLRAFPREIADAASVFYVHDGTVGRQRVPECPVPWPDGADAGPTGTEFTDETRTVST